MSEVRNDDVKSVAEKKAYEAPKLVELSTDETRGGLILGDDLLIIGSGVS